MSLELLQETLAEALRDTARVDDRELASRVREEGHRLVFLLNGLVRASRLYDLDNDALLGPAAELAEVVSTLVGRLGVVNVVIVEDQAYVNDVRLRVRGLERTGIEQLGAELGRHEVGGLSIHQPLAASALKRLARALSSAADATDPAGGLRKSLASVGDLEVSGRWRFRIGDDHGTGPGTHAEVLARASDALCDTLVRVAAGWMPNPLRLRRVVIDVVDSLRAEPGRAALAPFAGRVGASERHLISVCQLSLLVGRALGLGDGVLSDLGVAALLHDIGYLAGRDSRRHAIAGTRLLLRQRGFSEAKVRRLRAVLEHHDEDVAEARPAEGSVSLFARIVHLADHYDRLVAPRTAPPLASSPAAALARLWAARGTRFDDQLVCLLARELGLYPPGTLLELSDGSWGLSVHACAGRERWAHPLVRLVRAADGSVTATPAEIDLFERREDIAVVGVVEPTRAGPGIMAACYELLAAAAI